MQPDYSDVHLYRGYAYYYKNDFKSAADDLIAYIAENPGTANVYHILASCLISLERYKEAIDAETNAIALESDKAESYYFRGLAYHRLNENKAAYNDIKHSIDLNPNDTRAQKLYDLLFAELMKTSKQ